MILDKLIALFREKRDELEFDALGTRRSSKWPIVRAAHLKVDPVCQVCGTKKDLSVHHLFPIHLWPDLELHADNLITMCARDHFLIGHLTDWKSFNPEAREDASRLWIKIKGRWRREIP